ncbi:hypothetical protein KXD40_009177 [Peronospora effusa]|nr:hypothetical protein KXD40_009177 [Peronospora effusa]
MTSIKKKPSAGREQPSMAQRLPPPWAQQTPLETEIVVQPREAQSVPPPWDQQTPLVLARLAQSGTLHLTEPPWRQQRRACLARLVQPSIMQYLLPFLTTVPFASAIPALPDTFELPLDTLIFWSRRRFAILH